MQVGFLGYERAQTRVIAALEQAGCDVSQTAEPIARLDAFDLVVSFGYKHILRAATLSTAARPPLNLHIAYLPYNRGYHPNFWAHMEGSPHGVTIHEIDPGVDTGPIVLQREVRFPAEATTFTETYARLIEAMEDLFVDNIPELLAGDYPKTVASGVGSFRKRAELPDWMTDWTMPIADAKRRFEQERARS